MTTRIQTLFSLTQELRKTIKYTRIPYINYKNNNDDNYNNYDHILKINNFHNLNKVVKRYWGVDWKKYIVDTNYYEYNKVKIPLTDETDPFDMYLICWGEESIAPLHNHSNNGCHMLILQGSIIEYLHDKESNEFVTEKKLYTKDLTFINNSRYHHAIYNNKMKKCYSLHIYSPPNFKTKFINTNNDIKNILKSKM